MTGALAQAGVRPIRPTQQARPIEPGWRDVGPIAVLVSVRFVQVQGRAVRLTRGEMAVLMTLIEANGEAVPRSEIIRVSRRRPANRLGDRMGDQTIHSLRVKLGESRWSAVIVTIQGVGYAFNASGMLGNMTFGGGIGGART
jgi:DNA-binding response OmpR family regulator